ncbi:MAG: hypothetical protein ACSHW1_06380 [Yoonia sp.]
MKKRPKIWAHPDHRQNTVLLYVTIRTEQAFFQEIGQGTAASPRIRRSFRIRIMGKARSA